MNPPNEAACSRAVRPEGRDPRISKSQLLTEIILVRLASTSPLRSCSGRISSQSETIITARGTTQPIARVWISENSHLRDLYHVFFPM